MNRWICSLCLAASAALAPQCAAAAGADEAIQAFFERVESFKADFSQQQTDERGDRLGSRAGSFLLSRPGRFRWAYQAPYEQLMVCDGERIWLYDPDLSQATVRPAAEALAGTPAELLAQKTKLTDTFELTDAGAENGAQVVWLTPKSPDGDFERIEFWLVDAAPVRLVFLDRLGTRTDVVFSNIEVNPAIDAAQFRFAPPQGVEIIEAEPPAP